MASELLTLYNQLVELYKSVEGKDHKTSVEEVSPLWAKVTTAGGDSLKNAKIEVDLWKQKLRDKRRKQDKIWDTFRTVKPSCGRPESRSVVATDEQNSLSNPVEPLASELIDTNETSSSKSQRKYPRPKQEKLEKDPIQSLQRDISYKVTKRNTELVSNEFLKEIQDNQKTLKSKEDELRGLQSNQQRQQKLRDVRRKAVMDDPELASRLQKRFKIGRPSCEDDQPDLLNAILEIAMHGCAAHERRRSNTLRSIKTLDELTDELHELNFKVSRSSVYLRLLPKRCNSIEGRRYISTVPVRLIRATNDAHKFHVDTQFCRATIRYLEEIASILGPNQVLFLSQDDKARVPLGITAANKQAPMLMHLDYRVKLPDHDWTVAEKHKLIPLVYGIMEIKPNRMGEIGAVSYSGPTFIAIRSGKHCSSTALSHAKDLNSLLNDEDFFSHTGNTAGEIMPVLIIVSDGGPDKNPRYEKVINAAINHFQAHNLDALFLATNAPGRSAFNRVERRMAPLSRELCGLVLKHNHFGTNLDDKGQTVDEELERQNFEHAGKTLAEIWSTITLDSFNVKATYVNPEESEHSIEQLPSYDWRNRHVRKSHYFLQIVKCDDGSCCKPLRGNYRKLFPQFIPAPICLDQSSLDGNENEQMNNNFPGLMIRLRMNDFPI